MKVEPLQHLELDIPPNVHEIILVEDSLVGWIKKKAFENGTTVCFFTILWFVVITAEFVSRWLWG